MVALLKDLDWVLLFLSFTQLLTSMAFGLFNTYADDIKINNGSLVLIMESGKFSLWNFLRNSTQRTKVDKENVKPTFLLHWD